MGDRGNIKVGGVYLYTHWTGRKIKHILQKALLRQQRWNDESYLTRIIFCELCDDYKGETGYGISTFMPDNQHNILEVDCDKQRIKEVTEDGDLVNEWTFEEFLQA